jgi:hypothetical protein
VVESPEQDVLARTRIYVDNELASQIDADPKSQEKEWSVRVADGNHLLRLERWTMPRVWDWIKTPDSLQPSERFVRVRPGMKTLVRVKFYDQGTENSFAISQAPLGTPSSTVR